jgi:hypothetical protein
LQPFARGQQGEMIGVEEPFERDTQMCHGSLGRRRLCDSQTPFALSQRRNAFGRKFLSVMHCLHLLQGPLVRANANLRLAREQTRKRSST